MIFCYVLGLYGTITYAEIAATIVAKWIDNESCLSKLLRISMMSSGKRQDVLQSWITQNKRHGCSSQGNPGVDPSIWFVGDQGPEWVVVRTVRYPELEATMPSNIKKIAESCARISPTGHFASVGFANDEDAFDPTGQIPALPLWRGHGTFIRFQGLAPVTLQ
jgi:hypothetical protein